MHNLVMTILIILFHFTYDNITDNGIKKNEIDASQIFSIKKGNIWKYNSTMDFFQGSQLVYTQKGKVTLLIDGIISECEDSIIFQITHIAQTDTILKQQEQIKENLSMTIDTNKFIWMIKKNKLYEFDDISGIFKSLLYQNEKFYFQRLTEGIISKIKLHNDTLYLLKGRDMFDNRTWHINSFGNVYNQYETFGMMTINVYTKMLFEFNGKILDTINIQILEDSVGTIADSTYFYK